MQSILEGKKPRDAMISAGYSPGVASYYKKNLLELKGPQQIIKEHQIEFARLGITPIYMAKKTAEWLEATKIKTSMTEPDKEVPDYQTQLKAAERVDKIWGIAQPEVVQQININDMKMEIVQDAEET